MAAVRRVFTKPSVWIALLAIVAVGIVSTLFFVGVRNGRDGLSKRFDGRAQLSSRFTAEYLRQVGDRERRVARSNLQGVVTSGEFARAVTSQDFVASLLLDERGRVLQAYPASDRQAVLGQDMGARYEHLSRALRGDIAVSDIVRSAVRAEPIIAIAVPYDTPDGRRVFSSGFRLSRTPLDTFVRTSVSTPGAHAYLLDSSDTVISATRDRLIGKPLARSEPDLRAVPRTGSTTIDVDGENTYATVAQVSGTEWRFLVTVPTHSLYGPLETTTLVAAAAVALFVILLAIGVLLALRLMRAERALAGRVQQLEAANRTLDTFSHTLVHDLRNPLTAIGGLASTLSRTLVDADDRAREMTAHIESSAARMHTLIEDVLALATATRSAQRIPCEPRTLLEEVARDVPGVHVDIEWLPEVVTADRSSLQRAFQNLLANARAYAAAPDGTATVHVSGDETPWAWIFRFEDDGPGIAPADRDRVFVAFERGRAERPGSGTGLGLSIVAACAQAHGGSVRLADTERSTGACFVLEIAKVSDSGTDERSPDTYVHDGASSAR